jgi:glutamate:GABA antiporter
MTIVGVVALRWVARGARIGAPSITLWLLAWLLFFLPLATAVSALSARYPEQGGIYAWTRRAFGPTHGFVCGWCLWINNLFYFPSLLLFGAANALLPFGARFQGLAESRTYSIAFVLLMLWLAAGLNLLGLSKAKWLQNIGSVGTWLPAAFLVACGAVAVAWFGSATSFAPPALVPGGELLGTLSLWSAICFAFSGFELTSLVGKEVKDPSRTIPLGILLAGGIVTLIYIAGSASILVAVPASSLVERSGIADAIELVSTRVGLHGLGALTGGLLALSAVAMSSSWFAGAARVPFAAGVDSALPAAFARIHPRYRTPHVALIVQGALSTLIFLASVLLTIAGRAPSIQDTYDVLVNLTILLYFVPYLYLFASFVRLGVNAGAERGTRPSGGPAWVWLAGACGLFATATSLALVFVPPAGTTSVANYEVNLVGQATVLLLAGMLLFWRARRLAGHRPLRRP